MKLFQLAKESIDFQSKEFGDALKNVFTEIKESGIKGAALNTSPFCKKLKDVIKKYTNLSTDLRLFSENTACVYLPNVHANSIFIHNSVREYCSTEFIETFFKRASEFKVKNTVNLRTAKVTGIFSEIIHEIYIDVGFFFGNKLDTGAVTAVLLHEIGHVFTLYEFLSRQITTNQVLAGVCRTVSKTATSKEIEFAFEYAADMMNADKDEFKELFYQKDLKVVSTIVFSKQLENIRSELKTEGFDFNSSEQLADEFVARCGYARENIEALDIINTKSYNENKYSSIHYATLFLDFIALSYQTFMLSLPVIVGVLINATFLLLTPLLLLYIGATFNNFRLAGSANAVFVYPAMKTRYLRMKEQLVMRLKDTSVTHEETKIILEDIKVMDKFVDDIHDYKDLFSIVGDFIFPKNREAKDRINLQRQLEKFAMNDLFVKSAQLKLV